MAYDLRWYQRESCDAAWQYLCGRAGNPVIVLPTGAGKSLVIAELCRAAIQQFSGRVMILAHRKELLQQNAEKVKALLPPVVTCGLHSAGLRRFATDDDVIVAGIQSVFKKAELFGQRHLLLIDEVHLVPRDGEGMYRTFIDDLRRFNPKLRAIGLTATPFRTGEGALCRQDGLFQEICYSAPIQRLIAEGYLCPVVNQSSATNVDTSRLHIRGGEFVPGEVEELFNGATSPACREIVSKVADRRSVLIFCSGVEHAKHVADEVEKLTGERCGVVTGDTGALERAEFLARFRRGELRYLANCDVLTTGFDAPGIDAIAILRATMSPGLFAQMCGRGLRTSPSKADCLILDFGGNIKRHGPIDALDYGQDRQSSGLGEAPAKECPNCGTKVATSTRVCPECGWQFPARGPNHEDAADEQSQILAKPTKWLVEEVAFSRHRKKNAGPDAPDTLRVDYTCQPCDSEGGNLSAEKISEWVCLEHSGYAKTKAMLWWQARSRAKLTSEGSNIDAAIDLWRRGAVAAPRTITTIREGKFWRIIECEMDELPAEWLDAAPVDDADPWAEVVEEAPF